MAALHFLTTIRVGCAGDPAEPAAGLGWFSAVGLLLGLVLAGVDWVASQLWPPGVSAALVVAASMLLTGALHLDGLADAADGLFGGHTPARRLEIMRDSRIGTFGAAAVVLSLVVMIACIASLGPAPRRGALIVALTLSRAAMALAVVLFPYGRPSGLGRAFTEHASRRDVLLSLLGAALVSVAVFGSAAIVFVMATFVTVLAVGALAVRRLGGLTGDIYGAIGVLTEVTLLLTASALAGRGWLPLTPAP